MSMPDSISADNFDNSITFEWIKKDKLKIDTLLVTFHGNQSIQIEASYPRVDLKLENSFPLNEDMANLVTTHLDNFKQPLKKKRYK